MDKSTIHNKMQSWNSETKVKFNMDLHGFKKDQVVKYASVPNSQKTLIRRRFIDNDGSIEILPYTPKAVKNPPKAVKNTSKSVPEVQNKPETKPNNGNTGSNNKN